MKQVFSWIIILILLMGLICCMTIGVSADEVFFSSWCGDNVIWDLYESGTLVISGTGMITSCAFDEEEYSAWYELSDLITNVVIEEGITSIGDEVFRECYNLETITIPDSVVNIGHSAFRDCRSLSSVKIPDNVYTIKFYTFYGCSSLTSVTIGNRVSRIETSAFTNCSSLRSITIPDSVTSITEGAFKGCSSLESITIPFVGESRKTPLDTYQLPFGHLFGTYSYTGSVATKQQYYGSSTSSTISRIYYIPSSLKSVTVTGSDILYGAFSNCSNLTNVIISEDVTSVGKSAFAGCSSLKHIHYAGTANQWNAICADIGSTISVGFNASPDGYTLTPHTGCTFSGYYCSGCEHNVTPSTEGALGHRYAGGICTRCGLDKTWSFAANSTGITISSYNDNQSTVAIPALIEGYPVTAIGFYAFYGCNNLTSITIPDSVTSIGKYVFYNCSSLQSIVFPASITSVESGAFSGCTALADVYYSGTQQQWDRFAVDTGNDYLLLANIHLNYAPACSHSYGDWVVTTMPTFILPGIHSQTCTLCGETVSEEIPHLVGKVSKWNVALTDDLLVNFYMNISEWIEQTAKVRIYVGENAYTFPVSALEKTEDGLYIARVCAAAAQMSDLIYVSIINNGSYNETAVYTIRQYADTILADENHSRYHNLVREMLNYGAAAQVYFDYDSGNLANEGITGTGAVEIPDSVDNTLSVGGLADGISFFGASLIFRDRIAVRYYFGFEGQINNMTFAVNDQQYAPQLKDGLYFIEIADILPQNLDQQIALTVTDADGSVLTVTYGPMNYIVRMNEKGNETLKALVKALYNYHLAAKALTT